MPSSRAGRTLKRVNPLPKGLSCLSCRERRVRCDGLKPACASCLRKARWDGRNEETNHGCRYAGDEDMRGSGPAPGPAPMSVDGLSVAIDASLITTIDPNTLFPIPSTSASTTTTPLPPTTLARPPPRSRTSSSSTNGATPAPAAASGVGTSSSSASSSSGSSSSGPLQKGLACISCKTRRVKCDGLRPACSSCVRNARWTTRKGDMGDLGESCGCVYRADLPQGRYDSFGSSSNGGTNEESASSGSSREASSERASIPAIPLSFSPRTLPSLCSSSSRSTTTDPSTQSPPASPSLSPHGTPHAFYGHDLLRVSYPPCPYPPTDVWDSLDEVRLPVPYLEFGNALKLDEGWPFGNSANNVFSMSNHLNGLGQSTTTTGTTGVADALGLEIEDFVLEQKVKVEDDEEMRWREEFESLVTDEVKHEWGL